MKKTHQEQLSFAFDTPRPEPRVRRGLRVIQGGGSAAARESLDSPDAVVRVLLESGVDLLLRRITPERAKAIEGAVTSVLRLFEQVERTPTLRVRLAREIDSLEALMTESRSRRKVR